MYKKLFIVNLAILFVVIFIGCMETSPKKITITGIPFNGEATVVVIGVTFGGETKYPAAGYGTISNGVLNVPLKQNLRINEGNPYRIRLAKDDWAESGPMQLALFDFIPNVKTGQDNFSSEQMEYYYFTQDNINVKKEMTIVKWDKFIKVER